MVMQFNIDEKEIIQISAKKNIGIDKVFDAIVESVPSPKGSPEKSPRGFLFNAWHVE